MLLIVLAFYFSSVQPLLELPLLAGAIVLFRGCPMCWLMGLFETIANRGARKAWD